MPKTDQQAAQPTVSVSSLAPKPKGKTAKGPKGKQAAASAAADKARKYDKPKKSDRVAWDAQKRRSLDHVLAGKQFGNVARLHQVLFFTRKDTPIPHA